MMLQDLSEMSSGMIERMLIGGRVEREKKTNWADVKYMERLAGIH